MRIRKASHRGTAWLRWLEPSPALRRRLPRFPAHAAELLEPRVLLSGTGSQLDPLDPAEGDASPDGDVSAEPLGGDSSSELAGNPSAFSALGGSSSSESWTEPVSQQLNPLPVSVNTEHKPQSKVWQHAGYWWAALSDEAGTQVFRLDGTNWIPVANASSSKGHTDVKQVGDMVYVLIEQNSSSQLATFRYVAGSPGSYERLRLSSVPLPSDIETATIDIDSTGRMWVAYDTAGRIEVRYSDGPYTSWSSPMTLESNVKSDDIALVFAMPNGSIGVLWSNQNTQRFGFRTHIDGTSPTAWTDDEVPAGSSAVNDGAGMADDHLNVAAASDGTIYAAVKTSYSASSLPSIGLLIRRPGGTWDPLYEVDTNGTRPIVQLDEAAGLLLVFYRNNDSDGPIVYRHTSTSSISFSDKQTLLPELELNHATGSKDNFDGQLVVLASAGGQAVGRRLNFGPPINWPPSVFAGDDAVVVLPNPAVLHGAVTDDNFTSGSNVTSMWSVVSSPNGSTVTFGNPFAVDTTAAFNMPGDYVLRLTASDGELSNFDDVAITVSQAAANTPPIANNDTYSVAQGGLLNVSAANGLLSNDSDADQDPLTAMLVTGPAHGALTLSANGSFSYQPTAGYSGTDSFTYRANDGQVNSATATVTINVVSLPKPVTVSFQQGLNGYTGARDTQIVAEKPQNNYRSAQVLTVDGTPDYAALLSWNLTSIPAGSTVLSVSIRLNITNKTSDRYEIYALARRWSESQSTWRQALTGTRWEIAGARGRRDRAAGALGQITGSTGLNVFKLNAAGLAVVQKWINTPSSNFGFILQDYSHAGDGLQFTSRETSKVSYRPMLRITYRPPSGSNLLAAGTPAVPATGPGLTIQQATALAAAAIERWRVAADLSDDAVRFLRNATIEIVDLPGGQLGRAEAGRILIDVNAAGFGWFIDATPDDDDEFGPDSLAGASSPAYARIDLLTVLLHEQGHLLGLDHENEGLLEPELAIGTRRIPLPDWHLHDVTLVDEVFSHWREREFGHCG